MSFSALTQEETALAKHLRHFLCYLRAPGEPLHPATTSCLKKVGESKWTNTRKKEKRAEEKLCEEDPPRRMPSPPSPVRK